MEAIDATLDGARWTAVCARDAAQDGAFVFAVRTTGVYCRPSCGARRPARSNVQFFADGEAARAAGFRACKRCAPDARTSDARQRAALVAQVCAWIDAQATPPTLAQLAERAGYSPFHLQRLFRAGLGVTPREYAASRRTKRFAAALAGGASVTAASQRVGFTSSSRVHAAAQQLGMSPSRVRAGGAGETLVWIVAPCAFGLALVASSQRGICAVLLGDDESALVADLQQRFPRAVLQRGARAFAADVRAVLACVDGAPADAALPLDLRGTAFQLRVWRELQRIPAGSTVSYAELAARLGAPKGARAVASACAQNAVAVVVPCHRVVRGNGELSGYRWGVERKRALLERERRR
jgi:AraC family transcriptional regulator, regulatory protein of adaptative response / methylated-DNA-[protein]-cysteine methyltransferase